MRRRTGSSKKMPDTPRQPAQADMRPEPPLSRDLTAGQAGMAVAFLMAIGFLLRIYLLDQKPFWNDESLQLSGLMLPIAEIRRHLFAIEFMPPLSYVIQHWFWVPFHTTYAARFPSVLFGTAMIPLACWAGQRATNRLGGVLAAIFTACSFFLVYYSQECRAYIFFGAAVWLMLAQWVDFLLTPADTRIPAWRWGAWGLTGILCGAFHFAALILLPVLGGIATLFLLLDARQPGATPRLRAVVTRWFAYLLTLVVAALGSYGIMRYSLNPAWNPMNRVGGGLPPLASLQMLANYAWGNGWRWLPVVVLAACALAGKKEPARRIAAAAALLLVAPVAICYFAFPGFLVVSRYLFWSQWCIAMLLTIGVMRLWSWLPGTGARIGMLGAILAIGVVIHVPLYQWYYASPTKAGTDLRAFKQQVESLGEPRLFVLGNGYNIHHLQHYWPTNAVYTPAPVWNNATEYAAMRVADWVTAVCEAYPEVVLYFKPADDASGQVQSRVKTLFRHCFACTDPAPARRLFLAGFNMIGVATDDSADTDCRYTNRDEWLEMARSWNRNLLLFPGNMPLLTTVDPSMHYRLWRVLQGPATVTIINPAMTNRSFTVSCPVARLSLPATLVVSANGAPAQVSDLPADVTSAVFDGRAGQWVAKALSVNDVAQIGWHMPLRFEAPAVTIALTLQPGTNQVMLAPRGAPLLIGPPTTN